MFLLLLLISWTSAKGQTLLGYDTYALSLKKYYNEAWTAERSEFINIQRGKNWNLVPNVGLAFGLPSINLNTSAIASYKQRQSETTAKLKSINLKYELMLNQDLNNLRIEIEKAHSEEAKLLSYLHQLGTKQTIYKIHTEAYQKKEMKPLDYYKEKLVYEQFQAEAEARKRDYTVTVMNIEKLAHYGVPHEKIFYNDAGNEGDDDNVMMIQPEKLVPSLFGADQQPEKQPQKNSLGN